LDGRAMLVASGIGGASAPSGLRFVLNPEEQRLGRIPRTPDPEWPLPPRIPAPYVAPTTGPTAPPTAESWDVLGGEGSPYRFKDTGGTTWWLWGPRCCVVRFDYPMGAVSFDPGRDSSGHISWGAKMPVGFTFSFRGVYDDKGDCDCKCCVFRQFVRIRHFIRPIMHWSKSYESDGYREDVVHKYWWRTDGSFPRGDDGGTADGYPHLWSDEGNQHLRKNRRAGHEGLYPDADGECTWYNSDSPSVEVQLPAYYALSWAFLATIEDRCRGYALEEVRWLYLHRSGFAYRRGSMGRADDYGSVVQARGAD
jgi:hypothetical protein